MFNQNTLKVLKYMYDSFKPFQQLEFTEFYFESRRFEVWQNQKMIKSGNTEIRIDAIPSYNSETNEVMKIVLGVLQKSEVL